MAKGVKMKAKRTILILFCLLVSISMFAQEAAKVSTNISFGEIIKDSKFWGYLIILTFVIGLGLAVVRYMQIFVKEKVDAKQLFLKLKGYIKNEQIDEATKITESFKNTTLGFIFWSGLMVFKDAKKSNLSGKDLRESVQNAFDEAALQTLHKIDGGLFWFDTLAQTCTYLGLLGTIWGLLEAFKGLANTTGAEQNKALTQGIKTAIGTTAMGLFAAIPLTLIKGALYSRATKIIKEVDEFSVKMTNQINNSIKD